MTSVCKSDLSGLPTFNVAGGRPDERFGTRGSFTRGVRIMSGGHTRDVPREAEVDHGKVLFVSAVHKPDLSAEARTNAVRPTERLGTRGRFTPGGRRWVGGKPRDVPLEAEVDHGKVLFVSAVHKPDLSAEARTNAIRPKERLGSRGRFTAGVRGWVGGKPRDVPLPRLRDPGTVLFESASERSRPSMSFSGETNVSGGREDERHGRLGSFEHGVVEARGGPLQVQAAFASEVELLWHEGGQKENKYRRCGPSHFVAGVSILSGGMPVY
ncbi:hypothetical protein Esi_0045_0060 [Ectocarpus siliculosus]|uniref:Uncharacterized protein n=1 Tax=Ectocarpus siliculosus TaxID=2880 RepID=D7G1I1_ECTSI|nr:hypothetical protein Esi_0045_0060 [Ectocarpus siliculosus]|eukprot:CBJ26789.1 hypothetical protein Esi_0045_0060 [Ectocarpus siliculosus]